MISLHGRVHSVKLSTPLRKQVYRLEAPSPEESEVFSLVSVEPDSARPIFLGKDGADLAHCSEFVIVPRDMDYLKSGDIISLSYDGKFINALWRGNEVTNSLLLTERCDNYCLMCSQPPRERGDDWLLEQAFDVVSLMPKDAVEIGLTGGEPTLYGEDFNQLVSHIARELPETALHILSNGRRFSDLKFALDFSLAANDKTMVGIPLYGAEPVLHDYVVQAQGAFQETVHGIVNLAELGQAVEIRVVLHSITAPKIVEIAEFIARNLPFVDQVALMGLEMMGFARKNQKLLWVDPTEYQEELAIAAGHLLAHGITTLIYNHQLCLLHRDLWGIAVKSISDWKNEFDTACVSCDVVDQCGGFFHSAKYGSSEMIQPLYSDGTPKVGMILDSAVLPTQKQSWKRRRLSVTVVD